MFFSIVVPIYNVEKYISETIKSILIQKYTSFEIILVNDGSTDESGAICDLFANKDNRVKVIHKDNGGVSSARNVGIDAAVGDFILFVDGDDLMEENALEVINNKINNITFLPDVIFSNHRRFDNIAYSPTSNFCNYDVKYIENCNSDKICEYLFKTLSNFRCSIWSHIYRLELIKNKKIYFDRRLIMSEDMDWMLNVILKSEKFSAMHDSIYLYRTDNSTSAMNKPESFKKYKSNHMFHTKWFSYFFNDYNGTMSKKIMISLISSGYINTATSIYNIKVKQERDQAIELFKEHSYITAYAYGKKYRILSPIKKIFGDNFYLQFINISHSFKNAYKSIRILKKRREK